MSINKVNGVTYSANKEFSDIKKFEQEAGFPPIVGNKNDGLSIEKTTQEPDLKGNVTQAGDKPSNFGGVSDMISSKTEEIVRKTVKLTGSPDYPDNKKRVLEAVADSKLRTLETLQDTLRSTAAEDVYAAMKENKIEMNEFSKFYDELAKDMSTDAPDLSKVKDKDLKKYQNEALKNPLGPKTADKIEDLNKGINEKIKEYNEIIQNPDTPEEAASAAKARLKIAAFQKLVLVELSK